MSYVLVLLAACGGGAAALTKAQLDEASGLVHPMQPWADAHTAVKGKLGEPTKVEGDNYIWIADEGGTCTALTLGKAGDMVGSSGVAGTACH